MMSQSSGLASLSVLGSRTLQKDADLSVLQGSLSTTLADDIARRALQPPGPLLTSEQANAQLRNSTTSQTSASSAFPLNVSNYPKDFLRHNSAPSWELPQSQRPDLALLPGRSRKRAKDSNLVHDSSKRPTFPNAWRPHVDGTTAAGQKSGPGKDEDTHEHDHVESNSSLEGDGVVASHTHIVYGNVNDLARRTQTSILVSRGTAIQIMNAVNEMEAKSSCCIDFVEWK
jgi:hypothetical protein